MITAVESWLLRARRWCACLWAQPGLRQAAELLGHCGGGFLIAAASVANFCQPLAMGFVCGCAGWAAVAAALGSALGYWAFWGSAGAQGAVWAALGCLIAQFPRDRTPTAPLLKPAMAAFSVSLTGLIFQIALGDSTPVAIYFLRILLSGASAGLAGVVMTRREPIADRLAILCGLLALAQVAPLPWLGVGFSVGGLLAVGGSFSTVAMAGLGLDLSGVSRLPMTAVLCGAYLIRSIPFSRKWPRYAAPAIAWGIVSAICGIWDWTPLPALALGGLLSVFLPGQWKTGQYRGETGAAQVRLEMMAGTLLEIRQLIQQRPGPIDREALLLRTRERACGGCPNRRQCRDITLPEGLLELSLSTTADLGLSCKKPGRMVQELRRTQEQYRALEAQQKRQEEYRTAVGQQYCFLGEYLREQADQLPRRGYLPRARFRAEVQIRSRGRELANGDHYSQFPGPGCRHFVLLCDGMGTGLGAAHEGQTAASLLRQMLTAGFPPEYALRSLNSLLILRELAGAVTVDLAQIALDTGRITLFKWGAAPSYILRTGGAEKIGTAGPPPGLSIGEARETVDRLSLRRGEVLIMLSDGVDPARALYREGITPQLSPGELADRLLEQPGEARQDDATAAVIRISPVALTA